MRALRQATGRLPATYARFRDECDEPELAGLPRRGRQPRHRGHRAGARVGPRGRADPGRADGHPANGLAWLAGQLAATGRALQPGDPVITGGLTAAVPVSAGSTVAAVFDHPAGVSVTVAVHG